jgi:hypothetical protein
LVEHLLWRLLWHLLSVCFGKTTFPARRHTLGAKLLHLGPGTLMFQVVMHQVATADLVGEVAFD